MFCHTCNAESGPTLFCHICDTYLPDPTCGVRAGVARRLAALLVDALVCVLWIFLLFYAIERQETVRADIASNLALCIGVACLLLTVSFLWGLSQGQTLGKRALSLRAANKRDGSVPGFGRMFLRETLAKWISSLFLSIGYFWAIWDRDGQTWHDKIAGTVVIFEGPASKRSIAFWPALAFASIVLLAFTIFGPWTIPTSQVKTVSTDEPVPTPTVRSDSPVQYADPSIDTTPRSTEDSSSIEEEITQMLKNWASATANNDVATEAGFYAEHLDRYFLQRSVSNDYVRDDKQNFLTKGNQIQSFDISDMRFESISSGCRNALAHKILGRRRFEFGREIRFHQIAFMA